MTDDPVLAAVQKFIDAVEARMTARETEIRSLLEKLETRAAPQVIEGPPGKDGRDGIDGKNGVDGKDGKDGAPGERGADGIATREEIESVIEQRLAEIQVRTFADVYQGVYEIGRTYNRGLLTTWGGSVWLSQTETKSKPGESPDWKLVVKKGADARK